MTQPERQPMTAVQARAQVFITALRSLSKKDRRTVLALIAEDRELGEDLLDLALLAQRRGESSRPFREFLAERGR